MKWTELPEASQICRELIRCSCKKGCRSRCKCVKAVLQCTNVEDNVTANKILFSSVLFIINLTLDILLCINVVINRVIVL